MAENTTTPEQIASFYAIKNWQQLDLTEILSHAKTNLIREREQLNNARTYTHHITTIGTQEPILLEEQLINLQQIIKQSGYTGGIITEITKTIEKNLQFIKQAETYEKTAEDFYILIIEKSKEDTNTIEQLQKQLTAQNKNQPTLPPLTIEEHAYLKEYFKKQMLEDYTTLNDAIMRQNARTTAISLKNPIQGKPASHHKKQGSTSLRLPNNALETNINENAHPSIPETENARVNIPEIDTQTLEEEIAFPPHPPINPDMSFELIPSVEEEREGVKPVESGVKRGLGVVPVVELDLTEPEKEGVVDKIMRLQAAGKPVSKELLDSATNPSGHKLGPTKKGYRKKPIKNPFKP